MMEESSLYKAIMSDPYYRQHFNEVYNDKNNWGISADIDPSCLVCGGNTYELLSKIIPKYQKKDLHLLRPKSAALQAAVAL